MLNNFRQKFCFKTEDKETLRYLREVTGQAEVDIIGESEQTSQSHHEGKTHRTSSRSRQLSKRQQDVIDSQLMRGLAPNQVVALLNLRQASMDDVLNVQPVYV